MPLMAPLNPPLREWAGRWVWLVGASSGIGRALAEALHREGARVVVSARSEKALRDFEATHPGSRALPLNVTDAASIRHAATQVLAWAGGPPALVVYCAGHYRPQRATELDAEELQRHLDVNYRGALHVLAAVLPPMLAAGAGHLSLVGSVAGYRGLPKALAYGPTKAALHNLAEVLHLDLRPQGIGVSIVNPGFVATPLTRQNDFEMPALISADEAAQEMLRGWARGHFEIHFPRRFTRWMRGLRLLPDRWYFAAVRRATGA
ncbi:SDR family NAD(P)-dependent oxidoreductase [Pelomonas sp. APW6]|uniref:SDR family NAD(P)-dependent oxidoreductase n=1 Tax=Roseateles subflavus TaxID=3053353 RepID=A0ABT7LIC6_9BURK|nr:SDR family NAD(P)-dependent oxidoreductase [Pelomonas sp. APW6]MDL5032568.1 SDR family NAD(P)-dependent oxidoreductase [Pelomonas sp. APW6]